MNNFEIKIEAKRRMKNHYGYAILTSILLNLIAIGSLTVGFFVGAILVSGAITCCEVSFYISVSRNAYKGVDATYCGFRYFLRALWANLIQIGLYAAVIVAGVILSFILGSLPIEGVSSVLTVLPIIAAVVCIFVLSIYTTFTMHIMCDEPNTSAWGCVRKSMQLVKGHFWKVVLLNLSFIGWYILVAFTFGALSIYVNPYQKTSVAVLYNDLIGRKPIGKIAENNAEQKNA